MKCFYWNIRGIANSPSKLALKKLIIKFKPDLCFISEPWMEVSRLSARWLSNLGLKVLCVNDRQELKPNLWCLCSININPSISLWTINIYPYKLTSMAKLYVSQLSMLQIVTSRGDSYGMLWLPIKLNMLCPGVILVISTLFWVLMSKASTFPQLSFLLRNFKTGQTTMA